MRTLVFGGTRNLGPDLVQQLIAAGHSVTVLNRGQTPDPLPPEVERLRGDRTVPAELTAALGNRSWDAVVDLTLYTGRDARAVIDRLDGRTGHYLFISTGQVYLVLKNPPRPARESDYDGVVMDEPPAGTRDHSNWVYGVEKRAAEDALAEAWARSKFPFTSLRLPMVNSRRDHYGRLYGYILRLQDGGPIVIPEGPAFPLRHVFGDDVIRVLSQLVERGGGTGEAFNLSQDETVSLEEFLGMVTQLIPGLEGSPPLRRVPLRTLEERGLFPACSPFSDTWMSALDNTRSKEALGITYTPVPVYLGRLVRHYLDTRPEPPEGYRQRKRELSSQA